ncbi:hypothetical protein PIB30_110601, partial [Stylosanthes scabra]|nr:hypothetical protein [Stylosanthes scabra]
GNSISIAPVLIASLALLILLFNPFNFLFSGFEAPNLRKLADKVAAAGYYVVVPDYFHGDPYNPDNSARPIPVWLKDHGADKGFEASKSLIEELKTKGVSAIGAVGFCWGAKVVVELAKVRLIQGAVLLHPSFVTLDDIKG